MTDAVFTIREFGIGVLVGVLLGSVIGVFVGRASR